MANKTSTAGSRKQPAKNTIVTKADFLQYEASARQEWAKAQDLTGKLEHVVSRSEARGSRSADLRVRYEVTRDDYEFYRPGETLPNAAHQVIRDCLLAYKEIGIVRQAVDIMSEFAGQGIELVHETPRQQRAFRAWWKKCRGKAVTEQFLRHFFRQGISVIHRKTAKVPAKTAKRLENVWGANVEYIPDEKVGKYDIPVDYTLLNPLRLDVVEPELAIAAGAKEFQYAITLPRTISSAIKRRSRQVAKYLSTFPADVRSKLMKGSTKIELDSSHVRSFRYKPDDWSPWGNPMLESVLIDCNLLRKMKLADATALDGAMSAIRVWKLGSLEHRIPPAPGQFERFAEMLQNTVGGGILDIVWTADIDLIETKTDLWQFLGDEKYRSPLSQINTGLGIPPAMAGIGGQGGLGNNFLSLRTLGERLQYARDILVEFWEHEIRLFQKAMGFRKPAQLTFHFTDLTDQGAMNQLLLHLADRDLISVETLQSRLGMVPEVERLRQRREARLRKKRNMPQKASPYHTAQTDHELKKMFVQTKTVTPSEVGLELEPRKDNEDTPIDHEVKVRGKNTDVSNKTKGEPGQGRPLGAKDKQKRKTKKITPSKASMAEAIAWAVDEHRKISNFVAPAYLKSLRKNDISEMTEAEARRLDALNLRLLSSLQFGEEVSREYLHSITAGESLPKTPGFVRGLSSALIKSHPEHHEEPLTSDMVRSYHALAVATHHLSN